MLKRALPCNKRKKCKKPSALTRGKIIAYFEDKKSEREISRLVDVPKSTVHDIINVYSKTGDIQRRCGSGRHRKTTTRQDNMIIRMSKKDPFMPSRELSKNINLDHNINVSYKTVQRRLDGCVARKKPFISPTNIKKRLEWAIAHQNWTINDWKRVLWSDESPFTLSYHGRQFVWRPKGKAYDKQYIKPTFKHDGGKIQVWGCFAANGVGDLYKIDGTLVSVLVYFFTKKNVFNHFLAHNDYDDKFLICMTYMCVYILRISINIVKF